MLPLNQVLEVINASLTRAQDEIAGADFTDHDKRTLYGKPDAILDSLNLVSFVFIIEEEYERISGRTIKITTQDVLNADEPPFLNLESLKKFLGQKEF